MLSIGDIFGLNRVSPGHLVSNSLACFACRPWDQMSDTDHIENEEKKRKERKTTPLVCHSPTNCQSYKNLLD